MVLPFEGRVSGGANVPDRQQLAHFFAVLRQLVCAAGGEKDPYCTFSEWPYARWPEKLFF